MGENERCFNYRIHLASEGLCHVLLHPQVVLHREQRHVGVPQPQRPVCVAKSR